MAGKGILIVEDDRTIRENLREFLEFEGYAPDAVSNGKEALDVIRKNGGECVVLLDLQMPVMTGEQLLDELAKDSNPAVREVPILVLTARTDEFQHAGIVGFLRKPIDLDRLLAEIAKYCVAD